MRLPDGYDPELSTVLDAHARAGVTPGWFAVNFLKIADDFARFAEDRSIDAQRVLDIGGRSAPFRRSARFAVAATHEPREGYRIAAETLHGETQALDVAQIDLGAFDLILINLEIGGVEGCAVPATLNAGFTRALPVYGYRLSEPGLHAPGRRPLEDGTIFDADAAAAWAKSVSSHMHLGARSFAYDTVVFSDLRRDY